MDQWLNGGWSTILDDFAIPHIVVIALAVLMVFGLSLAYYLQNRNYKVKDKPKAYSIMVEKIVDMIKTMVLEAFGPRFLKLTPYFIFLFVFLFVLNVFQIFGIKEATTSYTVPLTLGLITWFSSLFCAIRYQKLSYLKKLCFCVKVKEVKVPVMINPIEILGQFTPLVSISFRIWGNIIAGAIIYAVVFWALGSLSATLPIIPVIVGGVILMPGLMAYLSLFIGYIQAYVFTLLSMTYISMPIEEGLEAQREKAERKLQKSKKVKKENVEPVLAQH